MIVTMVIESRELPVVLSALIELGLRANCTRFVPNKNEYTPKANDVDKLCSSSNV